MWLPKGLRKKRGEGVDLLLTKERFETLNDETDARGSVNEVVVCLAVPCRLVLNLGVQHRPVTLHFEVLGRKGPPEFVDCIDVEEGSEDSIAESRYVCMDGLALRGGGTRPLIENLFPLGVEGAMEGVLNMIVKVGHGGVRIHRFSLLRLEKYSTVLNEKGQEGNVPTYVVVFFTSSVRIVPFRDGFTRFGRSPLSYRLGYIYNRMVVVEP